jgi:hypothetical protein
MRMPRRLAVTTILILLAASLATGVWWLNRQPPHVPLVLPVSTRLDRFASTEKYVGNQVCRQCHVDHGETWRQSPHGRALGDVDLAAEPPDGEFTHAASGRSYSILRRDGELWHQEWLTAGGERLLLGEHPMRATIGSGHYSRSYLWCDGDFWMESPATWYAARSEWAISPGYDVYNQGFERPIDIRCIRCHAGRVEAIDGSVHRLNVHVAAVDCERCHGPGERHVLARQQGLTEEPADSTLVHPARLSRERQIDLCAQCHLHGDATVELEGDLAARFRPGLRLADFQVHFALHQGDREMSVVGHVEQMQHSRCYTESKTLTCTTCHDPHGRAAADSVVDHRASCLTCHTEQACSLPVETRRQQEPADDCTVCHMPRVATDIPHFAFRHHRIGKHRPPPPSEPQSPASKPGRLEPLDDLSHLTEAERERAFGLAAVQLLLHPSARDHGVEYATQGRQHLERALSAGVNDAEVHAALAYLLWQMEPVRASAHAQSVLNAPRASAEARSGALFALGRMAGQRDVVSAIPYWEQLVTLRRYGDAWHALARGYLLQGRAEDALQAARKAVEISPERPDFRRTLARCFATSGDADAARNALETGQRLEAMMPR